MKRKYKPINSTKSLARRIVITVEMVALITCNSGASASNALHEVPTTQASRTSDCSVNSPPLNGKISLQRSLGQSAPSIEVGGKSSRPNILIWLMDDVGFGQLSSFGGLVPTPTLDRLAAHGLRFSNFHATPLCSPSRAALLTGRNSHSVHMGSHASTAMPFPGYDGLVPKSAATTARVLLGAGYGTAAFGKWDHVPAQQISAAGPFDLWPTGQGFEHFYGFMAFETDQFTPTLWEDRRPLTKKSFPDNYHLTSDLADRAISYINSLQAVDPKKSFYLYWATGAAHAPHQAPEKWRARFRGKFDMGWDTYRRRVFSRQKAMGIVPKHARLPARPKGLPSWNELSSPERKLYSRQMEAFAAQVAHADYEFGRVIDALKKAGELSNTLIIVTSDNGASAEGGLAGLHSSINQVNGRLLDFKENERFYEDWGGPKTSPLYHAGWAFAGNTPFKYYKQSAFEGGHHVPLIISWGDGIHAHGEIRSQYHHIIDLSPTILDVARVKLPDCVDGVTQQDVDGVSMHYSFDDAAAPSQRKMQYYELFGNRGIYADGWSAVVGHKVRPWDLRSRLSFKDDRWELYNLEKDPTQVTDLAKDYPNKLDEMRVAFDREAQTFNVYPLDDDIGGRLKPPITLDHYSYRMPGSEGFVERFSPRLFQKSYRIKIKVDAKVDASGVLLAQGGSEAGYAIYAVDGKVTYTSRSLDGSEYKVAADRQLPDGRSLIEFDVKYVADGSSFGELFINGESVGRGEVSTNVIESYSASELFNIGVDSGAPAVSSYHSPFPFSGEVEEVEFDIK
jgi:arylsulfatase A-like enzyme